MNNSKDLYERAYYKGYKLSPSEENQLEGKWGMLYARNIVHRRLRGIQVNEAIESSLYAEEYEAYRNIKDPAFDELIRESHHAMYEDKIKEKDEEDVESINVNLPIGSQLSSKVNLVHELINTVEDEFDCHPSSINSPEDFDRVSASGPEMKKVILVHLDSPECCQHSADRLKNSIEASEDGNEIMQKLYLNGNEWF